MYEVWLITSLNFYVYTVCLIAVTNCQLQWLSLKLQVSWMWHCSLVDVLPVSSCLYQSSKLCNVTAQATMMVILPWEPWLYPVPFSRLSRSHFVLCRFYLIDMSWVMLINSDKLMSYYSCKFHFRYNQQHGSCIDTQSQQESRHLGNRLTGHHVLETLGYLSVTSPKKMQVQCHCFIVLAAFEHLIYITSILEMHQTQELYRVGNLHQPWHPMTASWQGQKKRAVE